MDRVSWAVWATSSGTAPTWRNIPKSRIPTCDEQEREEDREQHLDRLADAAQVQDHEHDDGEQAYASWRTGRSRRQNEERAATPATQDVEIVRT